MSHVKDPLVLQMQEEVKRLEREKIYADLSACSWIYKKLFAESDPSLLADINKLSIFVGELVVCLRMAVEVCPDCPEKDTWVSLLKEIDEHI